MSFVRGTKDSQKYLYHYTRACTAIDHILPNGTLRLGTYAGVNDPKESKAWAFDLRKNDPQTDSSRYDQNELSAWLSRSYKQTARVVCFSMDSEDLTGNHIADILKRGFCKPRMWAQYGGHHSGVCLVLDRQAFDASVREQVGGTGWIFSGAVVYRNRMIIRELGKPYAWEITLDHLEAVGYQQYCTDHLASHHKELFFEKLQDWRDEAEYRWVCFTGEQSSDLFVNYGEALVGLVFGEDTDTADMERMMELTSDGLQYVKIGWTNAMPWYDHTLMELQVRRGVQDLSWP